MSTGPTMLERLQKMALHSAAAAMIEKRHRRGEITIEEAFALLAEHLFEQNRFLRAELCRIIERDCRPLAVFKPTGRNNEQGQ